MSDLFWNFTSVWTPLLPRCLSNFKAIGKVNISEPQDFGTFDCKTSYCVMNRGLDMCFIDKRIFIVKMKWLEDTVICGNSCADKTYLYWICPFLPLTRPVGMLRVVNPLKIGTPWTLNEVLSALWLLMPWCLKHQSHQHPQYWHNTFCAQLVHVSQDIIISITNTLRILDSRFEKKNGRVGSVVNCG